MDIEDLSKIRADTVITLAFLMKRIYEQLCKNELITVIRPNIDFLNRSVYFTEKLLLPVAQTLGILSVMVERNDATLHISDAFHSRLKADTSGALHIAASALSLPKEDFIAKNVVPTDVLVQLMENFRAFIDDMKIWNPKFLGEDVDILDAEGENVHLDRYQFITIKLSIHDAMVALNSAEESLPYDRQTSESDNLYKIKAIHFDHIVGGLTRVHMSVMHFQLMGDRNQELDNVLEYMDAALGLIDKIVPRDGKKLPTDMLSMPYACHNHLLAIHLHYLDMLSPVPEAVVDVPSS